MIFTNNKYKTNWVCSLALGLCLLMSFSAFSQSNILALSTVASPLSNNDSISNLMLKSVDGPYVYRYGNEAKVVSVVQEDQSYEIIEKNIDLTKNTVFECQVDNTDQDKFTFQLRDKIRSPKSTYAQPETLLAISDIEGNFNAFYGLLINNGVMNASYEWTFGEGHLVLTGDFMDRGNNVTPVLWLIYKLEQEAEKHGGVVHFILGNHETLNLQGYSQYVDKKYLRLAQKFIGRTDQQKAYVAFMSDRQELVQWMKSKNAMEKIGDILFVHGGISPQLVNSRFNIDKINKIIRRRLNNGPSRDKDDKMDEDFLFASLGPLWYRGLVTKYRNIYQKATPKEINKALKYFGVKHISIGHTTVNEVSTDFDGKVLRTDVKHPDVKNHPNCQALLVINNEMFKVDGQGDKTILLEKTKIQN